MSICQLCSRNLVVFAFTQEELDFVTHVVGFGSHGMASATLITKGANTHSFANAEDVGMQILVRVKILLVPMLSKPPTPIESVVSFMPAARCCEK